MCNHHCDKTCPSDPKLPVSVRANRRVSLLTQETLKHLVNHSLTADNPAHKNVRVVFLVFEHELSIPVIRLWVTELSFFV